MLVKSDDPIIQVYLFDVLSTDKKAQVISIFLWVVNIIRPGLIRTAVALNSILARHQDTVGFFTGRNLLSWEQDTVGVFTGRNLLSWEQNTVGVFPGRNLLSWKQNTVGVFTRRNLLSWEQNTGSFPR